MAVGAATMASRMHAKLDGYIQRMALVSVANRGVESGLGTLVASKRYPWIRRMT